jgi:hypothetical protein
MTKNLDLTEVAVYSEDGRSSQIATFHGWRQKDGAWLGDVMVYGEHGQYRDVIPADRLVPLVYCGRLASGEIRHSNECLAERDQPGPVQ